jgi:hypothetical protein
VTASSALRWLATPLRPFLAAVTPDVGVRRDVGAGRYGWALLAVVICAGLAAFAIGTRLDVGAEVRMEDAGGPSASTAQAGPGADDGGELKTDTEIAEDIAQRTALARVQLGIGAALVTPLHVVALALALLLLGRFIGGTPTMARALAAAALAGIPGAVRSLVTVVVALRLPRVAPRDVDTLVGLPAVVGDGHPILQRLLSGVDVFTWWSVVLLAFGLAAAADIKRSKAAIAIAVGFALYLVVTRLIMGGATPPPGAGR